MKELKVIIAALIILSVYMSWNLISDYDDIDDYNQVANSYSWVSHLGSEAIGVSFMGDNDQYYIGVNSSKGSGIVSKDGEMIIPYDYFAADYQCGNYMAAATIDKWILMDTDGKEVNSFNRVSYPYAYAGDKYFLKYGDDALEDSSDGFVIIDAVSGETVKAYKDYYNAVKLDDGNWYISKTVEVDGISTRKVLTQRGLYSANYSVEDENIVSRGFFTDESFEPLYDGKEYKLVCQGDGIYVVKDLATNEKNSYIVMDENGELFEVKDKELVDRILAYEENGNLSNNDTITVFRNRDGNIGFASINNTHNILYYSEEGRLINSSEISKNNYSVERKDWVVFVEFDEDGIGDITKYGIKDKNNNVILPAIYYDLTFLPGTENIMVNSETGCGVIRLEVN